MKKCNELWSHVKMRDIIYNCRIDPFIFLYMTDNTFYITQL